MNRRNWIRNAPALGFGLGAAYSTAASKPLRLKITRVECFGLRIPFNERVRDNMHENYRRENVDRPDYRPWIVRVHTDEGLTGLGESKEDPRSRLPAMVGHTAYEFLNNGALTPGVMIAIYDLVAQAGGVPICKLFSPKPRPTVQATWWSHCLRPALLASEAKRGVELGYEVHKIKTRRYEDPV